MRDMLKVAVPAMVLLTGLTACGGSGTPVAAPTSVASAAAPASSAATTAGQPDGQPDGQGGGKIDCVEGDLAVTIAAQGTGAGDETGMVVVTNNGERGCTVSGWLSFTLVNAAGEPVQVPARKVEEPGGPTDVVIEAGASAFAGIKWTTCDKADSACATGNTIRWSLTGSAEGPAAELEGFPAPERHGITMAALRIGTVQPSRQGVVAW